MLFAMSPNAGVTGSRFRSEAVPCRAVWIPTIGKWILRTLLFQQSRKSPAYVSESNQCDSQKSSLPIACRNSACNPSRFCVSW